MAQVIYAPSGPGSGSGLQPEDRAKLDSILDLSQPAAVFNGLIAFDAPSHQQYASGGRCNLALDKSKSIIPGTTVFISIVPGQSTGLTAPMVFGEGDPNVDADFPAEWPYTPSAGLDLILTALPGGRFKATAAVPSATDSTPPTIVSLNVTQANLDRLVATYSSRMFVPDVAGQSVTSPTRAISSVLSGNGTKVVTYQLSSALTSGDTPNYVIASNRTLREVNGNLLGTGSTAITVESAVSEPALGSLTLDVLSSQNNGGISNGAGCAVLGPRTGSSTTLTLEQSTAGDRPVLNTTGINGTCQTLDSDGTSDYMTLFSGGSATTLSTMLGGSGSNWAMCGVVRIDAAAAVTPVSGSAYGTMTGILVDSQGWWGIFANSLGGGFYELVIYHHDGAGKYLRSYGTSHALGRFSSGGKVSFALRHDGTTLRLYMGNSSTTAAEVGSMACGAINGLGGFVFSHKGQGATVFSDIGLHALRVASTNWSDPDNTQQLAWYQSRLALP